MKSGVALDITPEEQRRVKELHPEDWYLVVEFVGCHNFALEFSPFFFKLKLIESMVFDYFSKIGSKHIPSFKKVRKHMSFLQIVLNSHVSHVCFVLSVQT